MTKRILTTRLGLLTIFITVLVQTTIFNAGGTILVDGRTYLNQLRQTATSQWIMTSTWIAANPATITPRPSTTPLLPTSTPLQCLGNATTLNSVAIAYSFPTTSRLRGSVDLSNGEEVTVYGKLLGEPWWAISTSGHSDVLWIEDSQISRTSGCAILKHDLPLETIFPRRREDLRFVNDTFSGFDFDWTDSDGNSSRRTGLDDNAQLLIEDRNLENVESENVSKLDNFQVTLPFNLQTSVIPFGFYRGSYWGFRFRSDSDPTNTWIEFRLIRDHCTVQWSYSIRGKVYVESPFELGESAKCGNDLIADFLFLNANYDAESQKVSLTGFLNDSALPSFSIQDDNVFSAGSFELTTSHSSMLFDYLLLSLLQN
jgi:hypothetical protein